MAQKRSIPNSDASFKKRSKPAQRDKGKQKAAEPFRRFQIIAGSYERLLYGLNATFSSQCTPDDIQITLTPIFSFPAHTSCIKAVAASPPSLEHSSKRWLATGSTDDNVKIWDLTRRKEVGELAAHQGVITQIVFPDSKLMLSASADSTLNLFRTKDWTVLRTFEGHKARINDVAVHPNGRIALSVGADRTLRFWDLLGSSGQAAGGGKQGSSSTNLGAEGDTVRWNSDGSIFAIICGREIRLYRLDMTILQTLESNSRFHDVQFTRLDDVSEELMLVACEDGKGRIYKLPTEDSKETAYSAKLVAELLGHKNRIKCLNVINVAHPSTLDVTTLATSISSDGRIHVYNLSKLCASSILSDSPIQVGPIADYDTKSSRLTCLTVAGYYQATTKQQDESVDDASESDNESVSETPSEESEQGTGKSVNPSVLEDIEQEEEWAGVESE